MTWIVIVIVCILIVYAYSAWSYRSRRTKIKRLLDESAGTFDEAAAEALAELDALEVQDADTYYDRANLIRFNIQENNPRADPAAAEYYIRAVRALDPATENAPAIAHGAEEYDRILREYGHEDNIVRGLHAVVAQIPSVNRDSAQARLTKAAAGAETRKEAVEAYFDESTRFTSDPQNVHDSKVGSDLRETLARLKANHVKTGVDTFADIGKYIRGAFAQEHPELAQKAAHTLRKVRENEYISTFNEGEGNILDYVWSRAADRRNAPAADNMREAVAMALADSADNNGGTVCINGRVGRILGSLATLDYDPTLGSAMTYEAYRNQIFQETKELVSREIERGKQADDPVIRTAAEAYDGGVDDSDADAAFKEILAQKIDQNLEQYNGKLADWELGNIRADCHVFAAI